MVAPEELEVGLQDMEVGEWGDHVVEVDAIVPHEDVVGYSAPSLDGPHEVLARVVVGERHLALAVYVAEHDVHVGQRPCVSGRLHAVEIGQCGELLVGEAARQFVDKSDEVARGRSLDAVHLPALRALAVCVVAVVLAHAHHRALRVGLEDGVYLPASRLEDLWVGEAPLAVVAWAALPVEEGVPLGMGLAVARGRQQTVEGVHPQVAGKHLLVGVEAVPVDVVGILRAVALGLAEAERRMVYGVDGGQRESLEAWARPCEGRPVVYAEILFEQSGHTVDHAPVAARLYGEHLRRAVYAEAACGQVLGVGQQPHGLAFACASDLCGDGQPRAGDAVNELVQQPGGAPGQAVARLADDGGRGLTLDHKGHLPHGRQGQGEATKDGDASQKWFHISGWLLVDIVKDLLQSMQKYTLFPILPIPAQGFRVDSRKCVVSQRRKDRKCHTWLHVAVREIRCPGGPLPSADTVSLVGFVSF